MFIRQDYAVEVTSERDGQEVVVAGWAHEIRDLGGIKFILVRDKTGIVQLALPKKKVSESIWNVQISKEDVLQVKGVVKNSPNAPNGVEVIPSEINVLSKAVSPLPLEVTGKVESEFDTRIKSRFMDLRKPDIAAIFKVRDAVLTGVRDFFESEKFIEINSPRIIGAGSEGGSELFPLPYYGKEAFLAQSPQLYKQIIMASGFDRIYEIGPVFRAEKFDTTRHISEIIMVDSEMSFIEDESAVMDVLGKMLVSVLRHVKKVCSEELELLGIELGIPNLPLRQVTYDEVIALLQENDEKISWGEDLSDPQERKLGELMAKEGFEAYFITRYPSDIKAFYIMEDDSNPKYSKAFDLDYMGIELASGGQREHRVDRLVERIKKKGMSPEQLGFYIEAFKYGMPPHGGFGLGLDRMVQLILRLPNVKESVLFPRDIKRLIP
ncbi:MAG: aspartate--tRNA(Asn) ligase [Candidatus Diapherotrites archaeon]|nr:aspartate--tRNA(Asn) ligase [Candidatus Diapherotrites archaeon]